MLAKSDFAHEIHIPVAIADKESRSVTSFTLQAFELCTMCGARFGIGYHGARFNSEQAMEESEELPKKLTEILAKDHRHKRAHKRFIDLDT